MRAFPILLVISFVLMSGCFKTTDPRPPLINEDPFIYFTPTLVTNNMFLNIQTNQQK